MIWRADDTIEECKPHLWIRDGSGAVCTHCGIAIPEVEKYAAPEVPVEGGL